MKLTTLNTHKTQPVSQPTLSSLETLMTSPASSQIDGSISSRPELSALQAHFLTGGIRFGNHIPEFKPPIPEAAIDPVLMNLLKRSYQRLNQDGPKLLTVSAFFKNILEDTESKKDAEKIFMDVLRVAPQTFLKRLAEAQNVGGETTVSPFLAQDAPPGVGMASVASVSGGGISPSAMSEPQRQPGERPNNPVAPGGRPGSNGGQQSAGGSLPPVTASFSPSETESREAKGFGETLSGLMTEALGHERNRLKQAKLDVPAVVTLEGLLSAVLTSKNTNARAFTEALKSISYLRIEQGRILASTLDEFSEDLTLEYEAGKLSPVIGRDKEAVGLLTVLTKLKKRNPLLVGEAGTGKTAIVEKLAGWLVEKKVPPGLMREDGRGKFLKQLSWSKIEALGPNAKATVEEIIREIKERGDDLVVFFDETHRINPEFDTQGMANMWKEPLARGHIALIGATTQDEYRKRIKKDNALDRRFQEVPVGEPSEAETLTILRGLREYFEHKHHVMVRDDALEAAAYKSKRYMPGKFNPDSAVDVIDTACAMIKNQTSGPTYPRLMKEGQLYLENIKVRQGLQKRVQEFQSDLIPLDSSVQKLKDDLNKAVRTGLHAQVTGIDEVQLKTAIESVVEKRLNGNRPGATPVTPEQKALQDKVDDAAFAEPIQQLVKSMRAAALKRRSLTESEKELDTVQAKITLLQSQLVEEQLMPVVGIHDILEVISDQANVPIQKISEDEEEKLLKMKDEIRKRVIAQGPAVEAVVAAIQKNKLGMSKGSRPIGSFLFLGPTGVGKTELAKTVAEYLFGDENAMIRVDMSELMEEHSVSKLIGSPPGYVGYDDGGQLTEKVRKRPYSVVLLDEIEKAHPRVFDLLLQILDDGRLTDSQGRTVDFKNAIVIMTSNKGTREIMQQFEQVGGDLDPDSPRFNHMYKNLRKFAKREIAADQRTFRPEFLNRIDDTVVFHPMMQAHIKEIIPIQLKQLNKDLLNTEAKVQVTLDPSAVDYIAVKGTDVMMGARPLKRLMDNIKSSIADGLLKKTIQPGDQLTLTAAMLKAWEAESESRRKL